MQIAQPPKRADANNWVVYILKCCDNSFYTGATNHLFLRFYKHSKGIGAKYTSSRTPLEIVFVSESVSKIEALKLEYAIKQFPRSMKLELVAFNQ